MPTVGADKETIRVEPLMRDIEQGVRDELRKLMLARGGAVDYEDPRIFESVELLLRRAAERADDASLLPEVVGDDPEWRLKLPLRFTSHRPVVGPFLVFCKQRLLLPLTRWLYEYVLTNFQRQQRLDRVLMACIEQLAIENAKLRRELAALAASAQSPKPKA
jgi:hypothetical protein